MQNKQIAQIWWIVFIVSFSYGFLVGLEVFTESDGLMIFLNLVQTIISIWAIVRLGKSIPAPRL